MCVTDVKMLKMISTSEVFFFSFKEKYYENESLHLSFVKETAGGWVPTTTGKLELCDNRARSQDHPNKKRGIKPTQMM